MSFDVSSDECLARHKTSRSSIRALDMMSVFSTVLKRDLTLVCRTPGDYTTPVIFFVVCTTLFSFTAGTDTQVLKSIGPGVIWVAALLAAMLSLEGLFRNDYEEGTLDQMLTVPAPLPLLVLAKVFSHWIYTGLPLLLVSPILGILMNLDSFSIAILAVSIAISTPTFSLIGAFGASLVITQKKAGVLLSLLTLPLCIPILIFSISAVLASAEHSAVGGHLLLLSAFFVFALTLAPFATAGTLRIMLGN